MRMTQGATLLRPLLVPAPTVAPAAPLVDRAPCAACMRELRDPTDRRHRHPFVACAECGPALAITLMLPFSRRRTTMEPFSLCPRCAAEVAAPGRRRGAAAICCPACGPQLAWLDRDAIGGPVPRGDAALQAAVEALRAGRIVAAQAPGGFQLLVDATDERAVARLRARKRRPDKPLPVLFADVTTARLHAHVSAAEAALLLSAPAPIVVVAAREGTTLAPSVTGGAATLGAMVPSSPLLAVVADDAARPLVCSSGNVAGEPICTAPFEALDRLADVADTFLIHDRPIARPIEASVARVSRGHAVILRRSAGYAPAPIATVPGRVDGLTDGLAFGAHCKITLTLVHQRALLPSPHLGDLDGLATQTLFRRSARDLVRLHDARPRWLACDLYPEYPSVRTAEVLAEEWEVPLRRVQHHHAHVAAVLAEHAADPGAPSIDEEVLGLCWDGTGLGTDGSLWGGEALLCAGATFRRLGRLRPYALPGGDHSPRDPRRVTLGLLQATLPDRVELALAAWPEEERALWAQAIAHGPVSPRCSSIGRLFDAVAALLGLVVEVTYPGQAARALEEAARRVDDDGAYPLPVVVEDALHTLDTSTLMEAILADLARGVAAERIARRFHEALVQAAVALAEHAGRRHVVLAGGCFQNALLAEGTADALAEGGFRPWTPRQVPADDGAVSIGQAWLVAQAGPDDPLGEITRQRQIGTGARPRRGTRRRGSR